MLIRTRLVQLVLSILIPAWLASAYSVWYVYTEQKQNYAESMGEAARGLSLLVDKELLAKEATLATLARSPALRSADLQAFKAYARDVVPGPDKVVVLSSLSGQQLVNTRAAPARQLPRVSASVFSLSQAAPVRTIVSDLFVGPVAKRKDVAIDVPVFIDGQLRYRMAMGFEAASLNSLLREQRSTQWVMTILDRNGVVLARSVLSEQFIGRRANERLLTPILARERSGIADGIALDGREVSAFFHRSPWSSWTVAISVAKEDIQRPARHAALMLAGLSLVLLGLGLAVARWYARKTAAPVESLRAAAEQLGAGQPVDVMPTGLTETDLVGSALSRASKQVHQHQAELERRVREAVSTAERSQRALLQAQKLEALGRLTGGIAHDFNNILQTLTSALQLMGRTGDLALIRKLSETSQRAVTRGATLTAQLRAFGRVQDVRLQTVNLGDVLTETRPLLTNALPANARIRIDMPGPVWPVTIDRLQFDLALLNVVINARDAMPDGGEIHLEVANVALAAPAFGLGPGRYVSVRVTDTGCGMAPDVLAHALDPFYTTKPVDAGSGLGLPQAYGFAKQSGGTLVLDSEVSKGTTVTMYLPEAQSAAEALPEPKASPAPRPGSGTVLFVEDDALVRAAVEPALQEAGFSVVTAGDASQALAVLASGRHIDAVFSDVVMPGPLSGVDLARLVRERFPDLPVLLASGHTELAIDLRNVRLIGKPYAAEQVTNMLAEAIRPADASGDADRR